jgi:hypothetical protein
MRIRATSILVPSALVLLVMLSACGASKLKSNVDPVAVAAKKTAAANTVRFSMTMTEQASIFPAPITITADGTMDYATQQATMSMDMSQMASIGGSALGSPSDWKMDAVMDGLVMYMKAPFLTRLLKTDRPWLKFDMESLAKQQGYDLSSLMSYDPSEVTRYVDYLRGSKDTSVVGHEQIRGMATTHYRGSVDFDAYLKALPADKREAAKAALDKVNKLGEPEYGPFDVWVDAQGRIRRETFSYSMKAATTGNIELSLTMDLFDYDLPVSITVPPDYLTVDLMQVLGSALGAG